MPKLFKTVSRILYYVNKTEKVYQKSIIYQFVKYRPPQLAARNRGVILMSGNGRKQAVCAGYKKPEG
jgi:hypothetical protein